MKIVRWLIHILIIIAVVALVAECSYLIYIFKDTSVLAIIIGIVSFLAIIAAILNDNWRSRLFLFLAGICFGPLGRSVIVGLILWSCVIGGGLFLKRTSARFTVDELLRPRAEWLGYVAPPVPMQNGLGQKTFTEYLELVDTSAPIDVSWVIGPAGVGKDIVRKSLRRDSAEVRKLSGTLIISLFEYSTRQRDKQWKGRTNEGLPEITSITSSSESGTLSEWIASVLATKLAANTSPLRTLSDYESAAGDWMDDSAQSAEGLFIVLDDCDEIGSVTLSKVISMVEREVQTRAEAKEHVAITLLGRGEILRFGARELRKLHTLRHSLGEIFSLNSLQLLPLEVTNEEEVSKRVRDSAKFSLPKADGFTEDIVSRTVEQCLELTKPTRVSPAFVEAIAYVDSANEAVRLVGNCIKSNQPYEEEEFKRRFFQRWWQRGESKHGLPPYAKEEAIAFRRDLNAAIQAVIAQKGEASIDEVTRPLLLSGFCVIAPNTAFDGGLSVKLQFPLISLSIKE